MTLFVDGGVDVGLGRLLLLPGAFVLVSKVFIRHVLVHEVWLLNRGGCKLLSLLTVFLFFLMPVICPI